jgi:hypothetical protein
MSMMASTSYFLYMNNSRENNSFSKSLIGPTGNALKSHPIPVNHAVNNLLNPDMSDILTSGTRF